MFYVAFPLTQCACCKKKLAVAKPLDELKKVRTHQNTKKWFVMLQSEADFKNDSQKKSPPKTIMMGNTTKLKLREQTFNNNDDNDLHSPCLIILDQ